MQPDQKATDDAVKEVVKDIKLDGEAKVVKTVLDRSQMQDAAKAVGTSMLLARTLDDMLVILHDALQNPQKPYMRNCIEHAIKAGMAQDRTYAQRLRRSAAKNGTEKTLLPEQPPVTPQIITLCGSTRFSKEMMEEASKLELDGHIVLSWRTVVDRDPKSHNIKITVPGHEDEAKHKEMCELHKRKIDISDAVFVVNPKKTKRDKYGYIGQSTAEEIVYAHMVNKPVASIEDLPSMEKIVEIAGLTLVGKKDA